MQYGIGLSTYKHLEKIKDKQELKVQNKAITAFLDFMIGFLLSRVLLSITTEVGIAPFGIAYLIGINREKHKYTILSLLGSIAGYLSIYKILEGSIAYCLAIIVVSLYCEICTRVEKKQNDVVVFGLIFLVMLGYNFVVYSQPIQINLMFSALKVISIVPVRYILKYSLNCIDELQSNYLFTTEELISIGILVALLVSGVGNINIFGVDIRNILALIVVAVFSYIGTLGVGPAIGVAMGFLVGMTGDNLITVISLYGLCALVMTVFKETGRIFSSIAYFTAYFIITMYSSDLTTYSLIEMGIAIFSFLLIPKFIIEAMSKEFDQEKKAEIINDIHLNGVKDEFLNRLDSMRTVLNSLSTSVLNLGKNDVLSLSNKGSAMVESLADRVCYNCELRQRCWDREIHSTFESFTELIKSCEENEISMPKNLERKCVKKRGLSKNAQEIVNIYILNKALKNTLTEGRSLISNHISNISSTMTDMVRDFEKDILVCSEIDKVLKKALGRNRIDYNHVFSYLDRKGRMKIKISLKDCEGANYCSKNILPIVKGLVRVPVSISKDGCRINPDSNECSIIIEETPKYHMTSYAASRAKDGESSIGDSYRFLKSDDSTYLTIISDGMGSGPEAQNESELAVNLVEKFIENGFSEKVAINTINSVIGMKFNEDEKFTTMDLNIVDLYTGEAEFIKVGGVVSFIKTGEEVKVISSKSLPFGILDDVDTSTEKLKLKHGDIIVSISDGILDVDKSDVGNYEWLREYLYSADNNPSRLSSDILEKAIALSGGRVSDDMTVLVSKIYSVY